jgi:hypothetical protein
MNDLIKQAIEKYEAYEAAREAEQQARQQTDRQEAEKEVEEMCQFLGTLMPQGLVQYANLDGYRREYSSRFRSKRPFPQPLTARKRPSTKGTKEPHGSSNYNT